MFSLLRLFVYDNSECWQGSLFPAIAGWVVLREMVAVAMVLALAGVGCLELWIDQLCWMAGRTGASLHHLCLGNVAVLWVRALAWIEN